ncbi:MAG: hypothetical protein IBX69_05770 [Anaerolineales bacterium]|nr:hypothetical protein [Anaerolineales bacterium]
MDIFFHDPSDVPVPPKEVRIRQFQVNPWSDGKRVSVYLELSPFQQNPNGEIKVINADGDEVASLSIIETIDPKNEFTIHLRRAETKGEYTVTVNIFYVDPDYEDEAEKQTQEGLIPLPLPRFIVVDQAQSSFIIE